MFRRDFLKQLLSGSTVFFSGLLIPIKTLAKWNDAAFAAETLSDAITAYYPGQNIEPNEAVVIGVRAEVENGAVVPIKVTTDLPDIQSITIFVEKNPNPLIANFDLSPVCKGFVSTRIKMDQPSDVIVVVNANGKLYSNKTFVEVHEGGCA